MNKLIKKTLIFYIIALDLLTFCQADEKQLPTVRGGFYLNSFPEISIKDIEVALGFWTAEVLKNAGMIGKTIVYKNLEDMRTDFYQGKLDFVAASPMVFVNEFNLDLLADGYKALPFGKSTDKLVLITAKQPKFSHFKGLKNKRLGLLSNDATSEIYIDTLALESFGKKAKQVFSTISHSHKSSLLILDLFFKRVDAILVYEEAYTLATELNPQIKVETQIIAGLANISRGMAFFHRRVNRKFREHIINLAINSINSHERYQLLSLFKSNSLKRSSLDDLKTTQQLKKRYLQLIKKHRDP
jgi:ABC-type phosphate/phosphonate transport system substrate-binding protein